jgi:hypothetical protein
VSSSFWLRGGWALDFRLGRVKREHGDIDIVTWARHRRRIGERLERAGFRQESSPNPLTQLIFTKSGQELSVLLVEAKRTGYRGSRARAVAVSVRSGR